MLLDAFDHGEEDIARARAARGARRGRAHPERDRERARSATPSCSSRGEARAHRGRDGRAQRSAARATTTDAIHSRIEELDDVTRDFAGRRMDASIRKALAGKRARRRRARDRARQAASRRTSGPRTRRTEPCRRCASSNESIEVEVPVGTTILEAARKAGAPEGDRCGGVCACSTCHVYVVQGLRHSSRGRGRGGRHPRQGLRRAPRVAPRLSGEDPAATSRSRSATRASRRSWTSTRTWRAQPKLKRARADEAGGQADAGPRPTAAPRS